MPITISAKAIEHHSCSATVLKTGGLKRAWGMCGRKAYIHVAGDKEILRPGYYCKRHGRPVVRGIS